jgi:hypothetical protein
MPNAAMNKGEYRLSVWRSFVMAFRRKIFRKFRQHVSTVRCAAASFKVFGHYGFPSSPGRGVAAVGHDVEGEEQVGEPPLPLFRSEAWGANAKATNS